MFKTMCALAVFSLSFSAMAQDPQVDFAIRMEQVPPPPYIEGEIFTQRITISVVSPVFGAFAEAFAIFPVPPNIPPFDQAVITGDALNCEADSGSIFTPFIPAGSQVTCIQTVRAVQSNGVPVRIRYRVRNQSFGAIDPDLTNNDAQIEYRIVPAPKLVPLSPWTYGLISLLMISCGAIAARRWA